MTRQVKHTITFCYNRPDIIGYYGVEGDTPVMQEDFDKFVLENFGVSDPYEMHNVRDILILWLKDNYNITNVIDSEDY